MILIALLPLCMALVILLSSWRIQEFKYSWLLSAITGLIIWTLVVILYTSIPMDSSGVSWEITSAMGPAIYFKLDQISWSYTFALTTFFLAFVLTSYHKNIISSEYAYSETRFWFLSLVILGLCLIACMAGNLILIIIAWLALDLLDILIRIKNGENNRLPGQNIIWFSLKIFSIILLIWGIGLSLTLDHSIDLQNISPQVSFFVILTTGTRLLIMPNGQQYAIEDKHLKRFFILLSVCPIISYLMLLTRTNTLGMSSDQIAIFISITSIIALYSSIRWAITKNIIVGQGRWIIALSIFTLVSVLLNKTSASISWSMGLILSGSVIFLIPTHDRKLLIFNLLGFISASAIPLSAAWYGVEMYDERLPQFAAILFILSQAFLLFGYIRHSLSPNANFQNNNQFSRVINIWGLGILIAAQYFVTVMILYLSESLGNSPPTIQDTLPSILATSIAFIYIYMEKNHTPQKIITASV